MNDLQALQNFNYAHDFLNRPNQGLNVDVACSHDAGARRAGLWVALAEGGEIGEVIFEGRLHCTAGCSLPGASDPQLLLSSFLVLLIEIS